MMVSSGGVSLHASSCCDLGDLISWISYPGGYFLRSVLESFHTTNRMSF